MARIRHVYASFLSVTWAFVGISAADESSALTSTFMSDSPEVLETSCLSQGSEPNGYDGLAAVLSVDADIYYPNSTGFSNATTRWSVGYNPKPNVVVVPATADDVAATVKYASTYNTPFLAVNRGHGATTTVSRLRGGIEIWLHKLNSVKVAAEGNAATIGGGANNRDVVYGLWSQGKQAATGSCECTSIMGPGLGGGHGLLQGAWGLVADNFLSMDVVLADGSRQTVDSNSDLWWGLLGAGHNFGIVTSVEYKIHDIEYGDWAYESFIYTGDKVEAVFTSLNNDLLKNGTQPVDVIVYGFFWYFAAVDPEKPIIMFYLLQANATAVDPKYTSPLHALEPTVTSNGSGNYLDVAVWTAQNANSSLCEKGAYVYTRYPIDLYTWNVTAITEGYNELVQMMAAEPAFNGSFFIFEQYPVQGIKAVDRASTAVPWRDYNLLLSPTVIYAPGGPELDQKAKAAGERQRQILLQGTGSSEMSAYVNYAFGDETLEQMYGYEQWRQQRLLQLKDKYDPQGKFSFYAPIA